MKRASLVFGLAMVLSVSGSLAQRAKTTQLPEMNQSSVIIRGRIVLYAWWPHELTVSDDFVVRTVPDAASEPQFFRIVYSPVSPEEKGNSSYRLDRLAFVGRGTIWTFNVHFPQTAQEKMDCGELSHDVSIKDEQGTVKIPAYVRSPGTDEANIPSITALPCYVLPIDGMKPAK